MQAPEVVGYLTKPLTSGKYTMVGMPFEHVNNDGKGMDLNKDITFTGVSDGGGYKSRADWVKVWNGSNGYTTFYWYVGSDEPGDETGWWEYDNETWFSETPGFENGLKNGGAVFFQAQVGNGKSMTSSGAVENEPEVEYPVTSGKFTMVGNPYPVNTDLNDADAFVFVNPDDGEGYKDNADWIKVWNGSNGYTTFYYYIGSGEPGDETGWWEHDNETWFSDTPGFANGLQAGQPIFIQAQVGNGKSVIFKKNF